LSLSGAYTYGNAPSITGITPAAGDIAGGTSVVISGSAFTPATTVTIGGAPVTNLSYVDQSTINAKAPSGTAGTKNVVVTSEFGTATLTGGFTYFVTPTFVSIVPSHGLATSSTNVTVNGTGFVSSSSVLVGGQTCGSKNFVNSTQITCVVPAHAAGTADVTITNPDTGTVTSTGAFAYGNVPGISGISPVYGDIAGATVSRLREPT